MEQYQLTPNERYLLALLRALLRGEGAPLPFEGVSLAGVFDLARRHSVCGMALYALENAGADIPEDIAAKWRQERDLALFKDVSQAVELDNIKQAFESAGVRILPLKGSIIKQLYPQTDMRTMSDIDALIDPQNAQRAREIMESLGYSCEHFGYDVHDVYFKQPVMNVEIHRALFGVEGKEFAEIFADPWEMCEHDGAVYSLAPDEFFAYILAHALKHIEEGGTGIRTVMDVWVCAHSDMEIDAKKALDVLAPSGRADDARALIALGEVWFGAGEYDEATSALQSYILSSGTYGTIANLAANKIRKSGKAGYICGLIFPSFEKMRQHYPALNKAPVLLPLFWAVRLVTKPFINRRQNAAKIRAIRGK